MKKYEDERGFFARSFCQKEFKEHGLVTDMVQTNVSLAVHRGTIRGLHYQESPFAEAKLLRCTRGALFDVMVDLRPSSPTYLKWEGFELTEHNYSMVYVPEGFAHGFLSLVDNTEATYQVSQFYTPTHEGGMRYDDPTIDITWPIDPVVVSEKDQKWPDFVPAS